jgi:hypothetical protein
LSEQWHHYYILLRLQQLALVRSLTKHLPTRAMAMPANQDGYYSWGSCVLVLSPDQIKERSGPCLDKFRACLGNQRVCGADWTDSANSTQFIGCKVQYAASLPTLSRGRLPCDLRTRRLAPGGYVMKMRGRDFSVHTVTHYYFRSEWIYLVCVHHLNAQLAILRWRPLPKYISHRGWEQRRSKKISQGIHIETVLISIRLSMHQLFVHR